MIETLAVFGSVFGAVLFLYCWACVMATAMSESQDGFFYTFGRNLIYPFKQIWNGMRE